MTDNTQYKNLIESYTDAELIRYINEYANTITIEAFQILKAELENRPQIHDSVNIQKLIKNRNNNFIENLPKFLTSNIKNLNTTEDLVCMLENQGLEESEVKSIVRISVEKLSEMESKNDKNKKNSILIILGGILTAIPLYNSNTGSFSSYIFCPVIFIGIYKLMSIKYTIEYQNLRENINRTIN